jgi:hypothetical protein
MPYKLRSSLCDDYPNEIFERSKKLRCQWLSTITVISVITEITVMVDLRQEYKELSQSHRAGNVGVQMDMKIGSGVLKKSQKGIARYSDQ